MSRQNDPRTARRKNQKGGKHVDVSQQVRQDDTAADDVAKTKTAKTANETKTAKPDKAPKAEKVKKTKTPKKKEFDVPLPEDLPDSAVPFQMYSARSFERGKWRWRGPYKRISMAEQVAHGDLDKVKIVQVWYDTDRDIVLRYLDEAEMDQYNAYSF